MDVDQEESEFTLNTNFVEDKGRSRRLRWKVDLKFLPLCAFIYLLNYLDRGNIGAARIMNEETGDDILDVTGTTSKGYAVAVSMFSLAYATFEIPSNWIMKRFVRPSLWLTILLFGWGAFTMGFTGVQTYAQVVVLRFFIGVCEAGFYPGTLSQDDSCKSQAADPHLRHYLFHYHVVPCPRALASHCIGGVVSLCRGCF